VAVPQLLGKRELAAGLWMGASQFLSRAKRTAQESRWRVFLNSKHESVDLLGIWQFSQKRVF